MGTTDEIIDLTDPATAIYGGTCDGKDIPDPKKDQKIAHVIIFRPSGDTSVRVEAVARSPDVKDALRVFRIGTSFRLAATDTCDDGHHRGILELIEITTSDKAPVYAIKDGYPVLSR